MTRLKWATAIDGHEWVTEALEKDLLEGNDTPEELMAEAQRLRAMAAETDIEAYRRADLMAAANYEIVAAERLAAA